jgi:hypothetical protein
VQAFPPFVNVRIEGKVFETHCTRHCKHTTCERTVYLDEKSGIKHRCTCVPLPASPIAISLAQFDIRTAKRSYQDASKDREIVVCLPAALGIMKHLCNNGELDLWHFLLKSPLYTKSTISKPTRYATAAKSANYMIIEGIDVALMTILNVPNSDSRVVSVGELENMLESCLHWDCLFWMQRWIGDEGRKPSLKWLFAEMETNKGLEVIVEKAREYVRHVVGALIWWDGERTMEMEMLEARNSAMLLVLTHTTGMIVC